jgi:HPt (histidine-containing phosphotransfer) domain-containing protein
MKLNLRISRMISDRPCVRVSDDLRELVPRFLAHRRRELDELRAALACSDLETVRRLGHGLKGVGGGYGFDEVTRIGAELERASRDGRLPTAQALVRELAEYLDTVEIRYE